MMVNPGAMTSLWIPAGRTVHCRWETDDLKCNKLMILSIFVASLKLVVLWKNDSTVQWISFLCMCSFTVTMRSWALFSSCNFKVFYINGGKINLSCSHFHSCKLSCSCAVIELSYSCRNQPCNSAYWCV